MLVKLLRSIDGGKHFEERGEFLLKRSSTKIMARPTGAGTLKIEPRCERGGYGELVITIREEENK